MSEIPNTMSAVLTTGHGGFDVLEHRNDVQVPTPESDQVLIRVLGAGINNTDINTRTAWYSKSVRDETNSGDSKGLGDDGSWSGRISFKPVAVVVVHRLKRDEGESEGEWAQGWNAPPPQFRVSGKCGRCYFSVNRY